MVKDIHELSEDISKLQQSGDYLQKYCSDYVMVTFPTIQSANNFREIFSAKNQSFIKDAIASSSNQLERGREQPKKIDVYHPFTASDIDHCTYTHPSGSSGGKSVDDPDFISKNGNPFEFFRYWIKYPQAYPVWVLIISPFLTYFFFYVPQAVFAELALHPGPPTFNTATLPPTILVSEYSWLLFLVRMILTIMYIVGTYLMVLPSVMRNLPVKRSFFAR